MSLLIRVTDMHGNQTYLRRWKDGQWSHLSKTGTPLGWSSAGIEDAVGCQYELETRADTDRDCLRIIEKYGSRYKSGPKGQLTHTYEVL